MSDSSDCIFCRIIAGDIPSARLLEDECALAFLDIGPLAEGHVLLIPKSHYETIDEMPADEAAGLMRHLPALVRAVQAATGCEGVNVLQNNGRVANQLVGHVHVHVIPRRPADEFHFNWPAGNYAEGRMDEIAEAIREGLE